MLEWTHVLAVMAIIMTNLMTIIALYCHLDNKTTKTLEAIQSDMRTFHHDIMTEMKDFHGRLIAIEERNKR